MKNLFRTHLTQRKWLFHQNYEEKKIGHHARLGENDLLFLWQAYSHRETAMLLVCAHYERVLTMQEIVRSKDVQCNTEESPYCGMWVFFSYFLCLDLNPAYPGDHLRLPSASLL